MKRLKYVGCYYGFNAVSYSFTLHRIKLEI